MSASATASDSTGTPPRGRRLLETGLLLGLLTLVGWGVGAHPAFVGVAPHPYLIVVSLVALRYGLLDGVLAAAQATVWLAAAIVLVGGDDGVTGVLWEATVFVSVGVLLGHLADDNLARAERLGQRVRTLEQDMAGLQQRNVVLEEANRELLARATADTPIAGVLARMAQTLATAADEDVYAAIVEMVRDLVGADRVTCYVLEGGMLRARSHAGWEGAPAARPPLPCDGGPLRRVIDSKVTLSVRDLALEGSPTPPGWMMAAPIPDPDAQTVLGVLVVEDLPFQRLNRSNVRLFGVIATWAGLAIRRTTRPP